MAPPVDEEPRVPCCPCLGVLLFVTRFARCQAISGMDGDEYDDINDACEMAQCTHLANS